MRSLSILKYLIFTFLFGVTGIAVADVSFDPAIAGSDGSITLPTITISHEINKKDVQAFIEALKSAKKSIQSLGLKSPDQNGELVLTVLLESDGGSVSAAIEIGKAIRNENVFSVMVPENASCVSACVLVLAGGIRREVNGSVGIHRPYLNEDEAYTVTKQKKVYSVIEKNVKDYLANVNVPTELYDVMFRIPPEKVRFLSGEELQEFNLNEDDPYYREAKVAVAAKKAGLTKMEYLARWKQCHTYPTQDQILDCLSRNVWYRK